jgi:hypothetical protein
LIVLTIVENIVVVNNLLINGKEEKAKRVRTDILATYFLLHFPQELIGISGSRSPHLKSIARSFLAVIAYKAKSHPYTTRIWQRFSFAAATMISFTAVSFSLVQNHHAIIVVEHHVYQGLSFSTAHNGRSHGRRVRWLAGG